MDDHLNTPAIDDVTYIDSIIDMVDEGFKSPSQLADADADADNDAINTKEEGSNSSSSSSNFVQAHHQGEDQETQSLGLDLRQKQQNNDTIISEDNNSYNGTLSSFSLGDVEDYLKEVELEGTTKFKFKSIETDSDMYSNDSNNSTTNNFNNSNNTEDSDEDDDIVKEEMNLKDLEKELALELQYAETIATPDRRISSSICSSDNWVSHTPESKPQDEQDEDFASAATLESYRRPPSPPNTFEKFFLPLDVTGLDTSTFALAGKSINTTNSTPTSRKLKFFSSHSLSIKPSESIITDDFASATEDFSLTSDLDDISLEDTPQKSSPIYNDILGQTTILEEETPEQEQYFNFNLEMAKRNKRTKNMALQTSTSVTPEPSSTPEPEPAPVVTELTPSPQPESEPVAPTPTPASAPVVEDKPKFDVVENVYEGAKSAWAFGKGIIVFKPFMGIAEGAATKVLSMTGIASLEDADKHIKCTLSGVDTEFIDPAILKLWCTLEPIIGKGDDVLKTVLGIVTTNVPLLKNKEETTEAPAVTPVSVSAPVADIKKQSDEAIAPETSYPAVVASA